MKHLNINSTLYNCLVSSSLKGLQLANIEPDVVGVSKFNIDSKELSVIVGLHGKRNGYCTVNLSESTAIFLAETIIGEKLNELDDTAIDAICELGNIVGGQVHNSLAGTEFKTAGISLPALIFGANYKFYHMKNLTSLSVTFEIKEIPIVQMKDRFFQTSICLWGQS